MSKPYRDPALGPAKPKGAPDPLADLRAHAATLSATMRNLANAATVAAGKPSTSHRDRIALERIAAAAGDLAMMLTMFGRTP